MAQQYTRDELVARLVRAGEIEVTGEDIETVGDYFACQTWIEGTFVREFTRSPVGSLQPNGRKVVWQLLNIFVMDDQGRILKEWASTDNVKVLEQLQA
jgi:predicted ester cyclase